MWDINYINNIGLSAQGNVMLWTLACPWTKSNPYFFILLVPLLYSTAV